MRKAFGSAAMLTAFGLVGCGNSCFVGFFNNGDTGIIVKAGNPAPACSLSQGTGLVRAVALNFPACESCTAAAQMKHMWVTLRSIQIRPSRNHDTDPADWIELAPDLTKAPRQIDLMGNSEPVLLVDNRSVPAGSYYELRLELFTRSNGNDAEPTAENACGEPLWNCILMDDGHVEPIHLAGNVPELVIHSPDIESDSLLVLPDARIELRLSLEPHQMVHFSASEGWTPQTVLKGHVSFVRPNAAENSLPD